MKSANISHLFEKRHDVMTVREIAQTIRCSESHILDLIHSDKLPCFSVGRQFRVLKSDVLTCFEKA